MLKASAFSLVTAISYGIGTNAFFSSEISQRALGFGLAAGFFEGLYFVTLAKALSRGNLGTTYAIMRAGAMLIVWILSLTILKEGMSAQTCVGALAVLIGVPLSQKDFRWKAFMQSIGGIFPWTSAFCIAGYHIMYSLALEDSAIMPPVLYSLSIGVAVVLLTGFVLLHRGARQKLFNSSGRIWTLAFLTGLGMSLSFILFLESLKTIGPGLGISLRNTSILFALVLGLWMGERLTRSQIAGVIILFFGSALLSLN